MYHSQAVGARSACPCRLTMIHRLVLIKMGKHISERFYTYCHVMSSDEDQPIVMDIYVGLTFRDELAISVDLFDYDEPWYNCSTAAIVNIGDARRMTKHNKVRYDMLPRFISECMEEWRDVINPNFRQVAECFKEITECLLDEGCRFRIERTYGPGGHMCC